MTGGIVLALSILACAAPRLPFLQPTPTPTATSTRTPTATYTATFTASSTPRAPVTLSGCLFWENCPDAFSVGDYLPEGMQVYANEPVTIAVPYPHHVRFSFGWCTRTDADLEDNLKKLDFLFMIDGQDYTSTLAGDYAINDDGYPCYFIGNELSGWRIGENHFIEIGMRINAAINDGWDTYQPGDVFYQYYVIPVELPTPTPTATATRTPTPLPTVPYYTATPACEVSSSLTIQNDTGSTVTLHLSGPGNFTFYLKTGENVLAVCPGTYSYTAYGCGGAKGTGTMTSGETHRFYCQ